MLHATIVNHRDSRAYAVLQSRVRPSRHDHAFARRHLFTWCGSQRAGRHERLGAGRINSGQSVAQRRHGHGYRSKHKQRRGSLFDFGDFANGNVRIARDLRWRRSGNGKRNHDARHRGDVGRRRAVGNIDVDGNLGDVGRNDIFGDAGDIGADRNVRLRRQQHHGIVEPDVNLTCHVEQRRPRWSSVGIL